MSDTKTIQSNMGYVIFLSGAPGSGKTTATTFISSKLKCTVIHQDSYFLPNDKKPRIMLSNGKEYRNSDTIGALDMKKLNEDIIYARFHSNLVLVEGFCLTENIMRVVPDMHIHLSFIDSENKKDIFPLSNISLLDKRILETRKSYKHNLVNDELMVKDIIVPFYLNNTESSKFTHIVPTFIGDNRISKELVNARILDLISSVL